MLVFLVIQGLVYFGLLFFVESGVLQQILYFLKPERRSDSISANSSVSDDERSPLLTTRQTSVSSQRPRFYSQLSLVQEDTDVATERARLANSDLNQLCKQNSLVIKELTKYYGSHLAVDHLTVAVPQGECFGLLGINGAGKTTTFKTLTGDELMSSGEAFVNNYSIRDNISEVSINDSTLCWSVLAREFRLYIDFDILTGPF